MPPPHSLPALPNSVMPLENIPKLPGLACKISFATSPVTLPHASLTLHHPSSTPEIWSAGRILRRILRHAVAGDAVAPSQSLPSPRMAASRSVLPTHHLSGLICGISPLQTSVMPLPHPLPTPHRRSCRRDAAPQPDHPRSVPLLTISYETRSSLHKAPSLTFIPRR